MLSARRTEDVSHDLTRGFSRIGLGTLVSRVTGFAREVVTAALFGAGTEMDIFVAAFTIPNLLCRILGETAVESAFMPLFKGLHARGERERAWRLAGRAFTGLALVLVVIVLGGALVAPFLVRIVARGFTGETFVSAVNMTRLMFPFGLLIGLAAFMGAVLLAFRRFRVYSLAPVLLNVGIIASVVALSGRISYYSLAVGVLVGGLLQFAVQVPFVRRLAAADGQVLTSRRPAVADEDLRHVGRLTGPVVFAAAIQRVGVIVDRTIASFLVPGSISSLYYSFRIVHLPYAILALAAGRAVAPLLAEQHATGDHEGFRRSVVSGLRMNFAYLIPVVVLSAWLARPIVGIVYQRGAFDETDLAMTASAFALYAVGLVSMGAVFLLTRAFAARLDTKTPVRISLVGFVVNVGLNLILVRTPLRHAGLALASSLAFTVHAALLLAVLNRRLTVDGVAVRASDLTGPALRIGIAAFALLGVGLLVDRLIGISLAAETLRNRVLRVLFAGGAGASAYVAVARSLGIVEIADLLRLRRIGRSRTDV